MKQFELFDCWNHPPYSAEMARGEEKISKSWEKNKFVSQCMLCGLIAIVGIFYVVLSRIGKDGSDLGKVVIQSFGISVAIVAGYLMVEFIFYRMSSKTPTLDVFSDDVNTLEAELNLEEGSLGRCYYSHDTLRTRVLNWIRSIVFSIDGEEVTATNQSELQCLQKLFCAARRFRLVTDEDKPSVLKKYEEFLERARILEAPTDTTT